MATDNYAHKGAPPPNFLEKTLIRVDEIKSTLLLGMLVVNDCRIAKKTPQSVINSLATGLAMLRKGSALLEIAILELAQGGNNP
jgi:hypothetical protein